MSVSRSMAADAAFSACLDSGLSLLSLIAIAMISEINHDTKTPSRKNSIKLWPFCFAWYAGHKANITQRTIPIIIKNTTPPTLC